MGGSEGRRATRRMRADLRSMPGVGALLLACLLLLTACPRSMLSTSAGSGGSHLAGEDRAEIRGVVDFGPRRVQADLAKDVARRATVTLIEVATGHSIVTALTDANGRFILKLADARRLEPGSFYYIEAIKGLSSGIDRPNDAGADAVRLRTIVRFGGGLWQSLTGSVSNMLYVNPMTTALSIVVGLRKSTDRPIDPATLIGSIEVSSPQDGYPDTLNLPDELLVPRTLVQRTYDLVLDALSKNRDPVKWMRLKAGNSDQVELPDAPFSILFLSPNTQIGGGVLELVGTNLPGSLADVKVDFSALGDQWVAGEVLAIPAPDRLTVKVPYLAVNGPVRLSVKGMTDEGQVGWKQLVGPPFRLAIRDGHGVIDAQGNVYTVNAALGTVSVVHRVPGTDRSSVVPLVKGLNSPTALTFRFEDYRTLYVACATGDQKVLAIDLSDGAGTSIVENLDSASPGIKKSVDLGQAADLGRRVAYHPGAVANPSGMAFRAANGALYVSDAAGNTVSVIASSGSLPVPLAVPELNQPRGLSFGPDGKLYVANSGANNVLALDLTQEPIGVGVFATGLAAPWGLAFDNLGNFYVSNQLGESVYRRKATSAPGAPPVWEDRLTSFASIPTPAGIDADASGYLYVADRGSNGVYRINPAGESRQVGIGISYPTSLWADDTGTYILTETGRILYADQNEGLSLYAEGIDQAIGLARDSRGNFYTNQTALKAITQVRPDGSSNQVITGLPKSTRTEPQIRQSKAGDPDAYDRLYVRIEESFDDPPGTAYPLQGEVLAYRLDPANVSQPVLGGRERLRALFRRGTAITYDAVANCYYVLGADEGVVWRVTPSSVVTTGTRGSVERVVQDPLRLALTLTSAGATTGAGDIWADGAGKLWVTIAKDASDQGGLYVYDAATGALLKDYSASVDHPTHLNSDGLDLYVNSTTRGEIRRIDRATGAVAGTLSGFDTPHGFAFRDDRSRLYVNEWGASKRLSYVDDYRSLTGAVTPTLLFGFSPPTLTTYWQAWDIETDASGVRLMQGSRSAYNLYIDDNGLTYNTNWLSYAAYSVTKGPVVSGKRLVAATHIGVQHQAHSYPFTSTLSNDANTWGTSGFTLGPLSTPTLVSQGRNNNYANALIVSGPDNRHDSYLIASGTLLTADLDSQKVYMTDRWGAISSVDVVTRTYASISLDKAAPNGACWGIRYFDGKLYQSFKDLHRVDRIDLVARTRRQMLLGLVAPDL